MPAAVDQILATSAAADPIEKRALSTPQRLTAELCEWAQHAPLVSRGARIGNGPARIAPSGALIKAGRLVADAYAPPDAMTPPIYHDSASGVAVGPIGVGAIIVIGIVVRPSQGGAESKAPEEASAKASTVKVTSAMEVPATSMEMTAVSSMMLR